MLSVCSVLGVAPVFPKRKEQYSTEVKTETTEKKEDISGPIKTGDTVH